MEDVLFDTYRKYLTDEYTTCRAICRRLRNDIGYRFFLDLPVKKREVENAFRSVKEGDLVGAVVTSTTSETDFFLHPRRQIEDELMYTFTVTKVKVSDDHLSYGNYFYSRTRSKDEKLRDSLGISAIFSRFKLEHIGYQTTHSRELYCLPRVHEPIAIDVDLVTTRNILRKRCDKFSIDPKFVSSVLTSKVKEYITTMSNLSLACYTLINAMCCGVNYKPLKPILRRKQQIPDRNEIEKILPECLDKII